MITIQHEDKLTAIGIFARFELADFRRIEAEVVQQLSSFGKIDLLVDLQGMLDYTLDVAIEDIRFTREHAHDVGRVAIISEKESVAWVALLSRLFVDAEIRVFDSEPDARQWLAQA